VANCGKDRVAFPAQIINQEISPINFGSVTLHDPLGRDFVFSTLQKEISLVPYPSLCPWDLDVDGDIDIVDVQSAASRWGSSQGDSGYDALIKPSR